MKEETVIISLGGSMIIPEEIDVDFLKEFKDLIISHVEKGRKFAIITGGGRVCRKYQNAATEIVGPVSRDDLDWIGITSCNLNAELMRVVFGQYAHPKVMVNPEEKFVLEKPIVIGGVYAPGHSSDMDAVQMAQNLGAKKVINLSNIDHVYDSDPKKNPNAKKLETISWKDYRGIIPAEWTAGLNSPFDPIASELAEKDGIEVAIMNGKPIDNLKNYLNGEKFQGTVIS